MSNSTFEALVFFCLPRSAPAVNLLFKSESSSEKRTSYCERRLHHYCVRCSFVWHFQPCSLKVSWKWVETRWGGNKEFSADTRECGVLLPPRCDKKMMNDPLYIYGKIPNAFYLSDSLIFIHLTVFVWAPQTLKGKDRFSIFSLCTRLYCKKCVWLVFLM